MFEYPWYGTFEGEVLEQGDILESCPLIVPEEVPLKNSDGSDGNLEIQATERQLDVVVMTQSCDLLVEKVSQVLLCPVQALGEYKELVGKDMKEKLRRGEMVGYHLLNRCDLPGFERDYLVVSFRELFVLPKKYIKQVARGATSRLRILPPYREHLSQAFARFFMRVGLPVDIPRFKN